jgi:hypothetical protein
LTDDPLNGRTHGNHSSEKDFWQTLSINLGSALMNHPWTAKGGRDMPNTRTAGKGCQSTLGPIDSPSSGKEEGKTGPRQELPASAVNQPRPAANESPLDGERRASHA